MYVVILGAGRIGSLLAKWFVDAGHEIAVIDIDEDRCSALNDELGNVTVLGDGTEAGVLAKAGANRSDIVVATTGRDDINLVTCQLAKHRFDAPRAVSLVNIPEHERLFQILGIDALINTTDLIIERIQQELSDAMTPEEAEEEAGE